MDGLIDRFLPQLDTSSVAGKITSILADRFERADLAGDLDGKIRYDVGLDTIYFASLLLMIVHGSGQTRGRDEVLAALDTTSDVIDELRGWIGRQP